MLQSLPTQLKRTVKEFVDAMAIALVGFPPVLSLIVWSGFGALVGTIVAAKLSVVPLTLVDLLSRFVVNWLTGGVLGPIGAPVVQALIPKASDSAVSFIVSGSGWWIWTSLIPKKQRELLNTNSKNEPGAENPPGPDP